MVFRTSDLVFLFNDSHAGTQIYVLNGSDPEGDPIRYGLTFQMGSKEYFRVEPKSGNVTLIQELDREASAPAATSSSQKVCCN